MKCCSLSSHFRISNKWTAIENPAIPFNPSVERGPLFDCPGRTLSRPSHEP
jgi:hypothetical protein